MVQINVPPVPAFQIPNTAGTVTSVGSVAPSKPVREEGDEGGGTGGSGPGIGEEQRSPQQEGPPSVRRDVERRLGEDRRKQQVPVLLDTRVGERRKTQRRIEDPPPPAVDFKV